MLINCPKCEKRIAHTAYECPHCGAYGLEFEKLMTAVYVGHKSASLGCSVVTGGSIAVIILIVVFLFLAMSKGIL